MVTRVSILSGGPIVATLPRPTTAHGGGSRREPTTARLRIVPMNLVCAAFVVSHEVRLSRHLAATTMDNARQSPSPLSSPARGRGNSRSQLVMFPSPLAGEGRVRGVAETSSQENNKRNVSNAESAGRDELSEGRPPAHDWQGFWPEFQEEWMRRHGPTDLLGHFGDDMRLVATESGTSAKSRGSPGREPGREEIAVIRIGREERHSMIRLLAPDLPHALEPPDGRTGYPRLGSLRSDHLVLDTNGTLACDRRPWPLWQASATLRFHQQ